ncbi:GntR family transcriptional regulator [Streptomyces sp. NRRL S-1813]|uniref:GntR family transcriptional regulator n=1 Tax=Streptomyces sp. NRRL S-1813 TaxID=1463888 RepID=UPI003B639499
MRRERSAPPAETELAARCGVSRGTVRQAVAALPAEGLIGSREGPAEGLIGSYQGIRRVVLAGCRSQSFAELGGFARAQARGRHRAVDGDPPPASSLGPTAPQPRRAASVRTWPHSSNGAVNPSKSPTRPLGPTAWSSKAPRNPPSRGLPSHDQSTINMVMSSPMGGGSRAVLAVLTRRCRPDRTVGRPSPSGMPFSAQQPLTYAGPLSHGRWSWDEGRYAGPGRHPDPARCPQGGVP